MKIQTLASLMLVCATWVQTVHAQEQKTAFCASSVEIYRKRDSNDIYLCQTSKYTCGPYLSPSCLDDAKSGGWEVTSSAKQSLLKDYASTPCTCIGTQYTLTRKAPAEAPAPAPAAAAPAAAPVAAPATAAPAAAPAVAAAPVVAVAAAPVAAAPAPASSLAAEVEALKQDNQQIKRMLEQLQKQINELRNK